MKQGIFSTLSSTYFSSAKNSFHYVGSRSLLLKPFSFAIALLYTSILLPIGIIFFLLIFLDWVGNLTDAIRRFFLNLMEKQSWSVDNSIFSFLLRPIILVILSPIFLLSIFIPKLSSNSMVHLAVNEVSDAVSGAGAFKQINIIIYRAANRLFIYVSTSPLIMKPFLAIVAIIYSIILIILGTIFIIFIPLDWISRLIEKLRQSIVRYTSNQQHNIKYNTGAFLFTPIFLTILAPIILIVILFPKFTTNVDLEV